MSSSMVGIASIVVTLLLFGVGYLIRGMLATGQLTAQVKDLAIKSDKTATAVEEIRAGMLRPSDLENAILKLKLEVVRGSLARESDK
jgi:hypothetical protein